MRGQFRLGIMIFWLCMLLACSPLLTTSPATEQVTPSQPSATEAPPTVAESEPPMERPTATEAGTVKPTGTEETVCNFDSKFVADLTIPDDTEIAPGELFRKTWRVRNSGSCNWLPGTRLVFVDGEPMSSAASVIAPAAEVDSVSKLSVDFTAPLVPGSYRSDWRLEAPDGTRFGAKLFVRIVVPAVNTETLEPGATDTATAPPPATPLSCSTPVDAALAPVMAQVVAEGLDLGCPLGAAYDSSGAAQEFWANVEDVNPQTHFRSLMLWNVPYKQGEIYTVRGWDTEAYAATITASYDYWEEPQPEVHPDCASLTVPAGYLMPIRGFGKVWCENELYATIGWPNAAEYGASLRVQMMENGRLIRVSGGYMDYIVAWQYDGGLGTVKLEAP